MARDEFVIIIKAQALFTPRAAISAGLSHLIRSLEFVGMVGWVWVGFERVGFVKLGGFAGLGA